MTNDILRGQVARAFASKTPWSIDQETAYQGWATRQPWFRTAYAGSAPDWAAPELDRRDEWLRTAAFEPSGGDDQLTTSAGNDTVGGWPTDGPVGVRAKNPLNFRPGIGWEGELGRSARARMASSPSSIRH